MYTNKCEKRLAVTGAPPRKISYVMSVDGLPNQLGAGLYDETATTAELGEPTGPAQ
jgi:hypothetical protein